MPTNTISISFPGSRNLTDEQTNNLINDLQNHPVRKLTKEERDIYAGAAINAVRIMPAFRDAISLLNPYLDSTCSTAYTDRYARMGLSYWFLYLLDPHQRGSVLLHEAMHVMNNQFNRAEAAGILHDPQLFNIAGDFEINTTLERARGVDLSVGIYPNKSPYNYEPGMTMEQYAYLLQQDKPDTGDKVSGPDDDSAPDPEGNDSGDNGEQDGGGEGGDQEGEGSSDGSGSESQSGEGGSKKGKPGSGNGDPG